MSQLWFVDGVWMNIEQVKERNKKKEETEEEIVKEEKKPEEEKVSVGDVLGISESTESVIVGKFVESELYEMKNSELMDILRENNIRTTGVPSKKTMVELLMKKNS
ncbi:MAG TPA: hypothetical protein PKA71_02180 [Saprospiraceae bacterium]|jgi:hypothetical protein|nr:hypothetical protein [Saprospiraceae bacterium]